MVLFVRMFLLTLLNLYAVRLILNGLGEEDYGIFNTVAGVVTLGSFLSGVMALSIQRFFSIALGEGDTQKLNDIFSSSINILAGFSFILIVFFETIGLWFLQTKIHVSVDRIDATLWIYQFAIFAFICSIMQIPYTAAIFAREEMGTYAFISTIDCLLRLGVAFLIGKLLMDNLIFYGLGIMIVAIIVFLMYAWYGHKHYPECHYVHSRRNVLSKNLLSFSGWAMLGTVASVGIIQGGIILLGMFFGPIINAAFGVALQINNAFQSLCNSMVLPFRSAMMRTFAEKQFEYLDKLFAVSNKFIFYILLAVSVPIIMEMDTILHLWLGNNVSDNTILFSRLIIIYIILISLHHPISIIMQASGHVKEYHLPVESATLMCVPITYLLFWLELPSYSVFYSMIGVCVAAHVIRLICLCRYYDRFSLGEYIISFILPALFITVVVGMIAYYLRQHIDGTFTQFLSAIILLPLSVFVLAYLFGINRKEKEFMKHFIHHFIKKRAS